MAVSGALVIFLWMVIAATAPWIAPYDPIEQNIPIRLAAPSEAHWLGADGLGRDVLSRVLYGGRVSLPVAAVVVVLASFAWGVLCSILLASPPTRS